MSSRAIAIIATIVLAGPALRVQAHDEPPKTVAERRDQADRCALYAACRVQTQQQFVTRPGQDGADGAVTRATRYA